MKKLPIYFKQGPILPLFSNTSGHRKSNFRKWQLLVYPFTLAGDPAALSVGCWHRKRFSLGNTLFGRFRFHPSSKTLACCLDLFVRLSLNLSFRERVSGSNPCQGTLLSHYTIPIILQIVIPNVCQNSSTLRKNNTNQLPL